MLKTSILSAEWASKSDKVVSISLRLSYGPSRNSFLLNFVQKKKPFERIFQLLMGTSNGKIRFYDTETKITRCELSTDSQNSR